MSKKELFVFAILLISLIHQTNSQSNGDVANSECGEVQEAKPVRKARAIGDTMLGLIQWPFSLLSWLFQLIRIPFSITSTLTSLYTNLLGGWVVTVPIKLMKFVFSNLWDMTKKFVLPTLDDFSMKLMDSDSIPDDLKTTINSAHSTYRLMKLLGFLRPV